MVNDQDFPKLKGGLDKGGIGQRRIRYILKLFNFYSILKFLYHN